MAQKGEVIKTRGNEFFKEAEYKEAENCYSQAIQQDPSNPVFWRNRANARKHLHEWEGVLDDSLRCIELLPKDHRGYFFLAEAQLALCHPNEALSSALTAYNNCLGNSNRDSARAADLVLKCKKAKWEARQRSTTRRRGALIDELIDLLKQAQNKELDALVERIRRGRVGSVVGEEDMAAIKEATERKIQELRSIFTAANSDQRPPREIPEYLVDMISIEIMHDPVITKEGHSYERMTITDHLKRTPTDPLTREVLTLDDLRPNLALKKACDEFWDSDPGRAVEW